QVIGLLKEMPERDVGQVYSDQGARVAARELLGHGTAPVASMCCEAVVSEDVGHQRMPEISDAKDGPRRRRLVGESKAWKARRDDVEGIGGIRAVRLRMREHRDQFREPQE